MVASSQWYSFCSGPFCFCKKWAMRNQKMLRWNEVISAWKEFHQTDIEKVFINTHTFNIHLVKCILQVHDIHSMMLSDLWSETISWVYLFANIVFCWSSVFVIGSLSTNLFWICLSTNARENWTIIAHSNDRIRFFFTSPSSFVFFVFLKCSLFLRFKFIFAFWLRSTVLHKDTDSNMYN